MREGGKGGGEGEGGDGEGEGVEGREGGKECRRRKLGARGGRERGVKDKTRV